MDVFQLSPDLPKVLDITDLDTDWGKGRFVPSVRGGIIFATLYLVWFAIWGPPETVITDRRSENENDAVINALHSMGVHWRPVPTGAPWGIGRNERHHGPIRDAFVRIVAETPRLAPNLALAMAYKARNDAPRVHGVAPTTAVTGDHPRLIVGDNHHDDPTIAVRATSMQTERNTMERYSAADRLRGALSHPGTSVPFVIVGQQVWFYRHKHGCLRGTVDSLKGKTFFLCLLGEGFVRGEGKIFSSHESRTKPFVGRSHLPPDPPCLAPAPPGPIRTHTPAPPSTPTLAPVAAAYLIHAPDLSSHRHPRWNVGKRHEINVFDSFECKTTIPAAAVPPGEQIFDYLWRCDYKPDRGNGTPPTSARFCIAGAREWNKANDIPTSPVSPHRAVRATIAVVFILGWGVHTKDSLRAYLQSDLLPKPVYVQSPPEADEPPSSVWAFSRPMYGKGNAGRHFHFSTQSKFLPITGVALSSAFDTVYYVPRRGSISSYC